MFPEYFPVNFMLCHVFYMICVCCFLPLKKSLRSRRVFLPLDPCSVLAKDTKADAKAIPKPDLSMSKASEKATMIWSQVFF